MSDIVHDRRRLLRSCAAWVAGAAAFVLAPRANAWEMQKLSPASPLGLAYANHCGGPTDHAWLVAELKDELANDPSAQSLSAQCPLCGCPVIVTR